MKVFRQGKIYNYDTTYCDESWSYEQILKASSFYATCKHFGYNDSLSYSLSSMYIYLDTQPEMMFEQTYMDMLSKINYLLEKA